MPLLTSKLLYSDSSVKYLYASEGQDERSPNGVHKSRWIGVICDQVIVEAMRDESKMRCVE